MQGMCAFPSDDCLFEGWMVIPGMGVLFKGCVVIRAVDAYLRCECLFERWVLNQEVCAYSSNRSYCLFERWCLFEG